MSTPPVKYLRYFDFTTYATLNPNLPLPGASVDVELNRLKSTTDQTIDRLNLIQRDDGLLRDGAITTNSLADGAVTTPKLADGAVTTPKLADGSVTGAKIAPGSLTGIGLAAGSITSRELADGGVQTVDLAPLSVTTPILADNAVTTPKILDAAVTAAKLAPGAVTPGAIADGTVPAAKLVPGSVGTAQLTDGGVTTPKLANGAVTSAKIADGTIDPVDFSALSLQLITTAGNPRGAWATATNYAPRDAVTMANGVYICLLAHVSGVFAVDLAAGDWFQTGQVFDQSLNKADTVQFAKLGLGMVPVNILDMTGSAANAPAIASLVNANAGNAAVARFTASNGASISSLYQLGAGYAPNGVLQPGYGGLSCSNGMFFTAGGPFLWGTGAGVEKMRLDANGNLGLGVVPNPAWAYKVLQLGTNSSLYNTGTGTVVGANNYYDGAANRYLAAGGGALFNADAGGTFSWYNAPVGAAGAVAAHTLRMTLDANGNLIVAGALSVGVGGKLDTVYGRTFTMALSSLSGGGQYDVLHVPPGPGFTTLKVRGTVFNQSSQTNYTWQYREDIFYCSDSGGVDNSRGPYNLGNNSFSINSGVLAAGFSWDFIRSSGMQYLRVYPTITGSGSGGVLLQAHFEISLYGDSAKTAF